MALGLALVIVNLICYFLVGIIGPENMAPLFNSFAHGVDITPIISQSTMSFGYVCLGFLELFIIGSVTGWLIGWAYNAFTKEKAVS